jgi:hypothetical protein
MKNLLFRPSEAQSNKLSDDFRSFKLVFLDFVFAFDFKDQLDADFIDRVFSS